MQSLDLKLAFRMLVKNPALTIAGGLALALGIPVALVPIQLGKGINAPLPIPDGHRVVALQFRDRSIDNERHATTHDVERWQRELTSFESIGAARRRVDNIVAAGGTMDVARGAEMSASAFAALRVRPLHGRPLVAGDEIAGAPDVVVIGARLWRQYFGGDATAVGRTLRFGDAIRTVVGVMPEEFQFPYRESYWVPMRARARDHAIGEGPRFLVFGRLRDGVSGEQAQAELRTIESRNVESPDIYRHLEGEVIAYQHAASGLTATWDRMGGAFLVTLSLLVVACGNVGTLMLARTSTRMNEIAIRAALGAGRTRIVLQLFLEALILSGLAAALGLALGELVVSRMARLTLLMPFWFSLHVDASTVMLAAGLALFSAVIAGLLPALRATRRDAYPLLKRQGGAATGLRFGHVAGALIVAEVALAVGGLSGVASVARGAFQVPDVSDRIAMNEYLTTPLRLPEESPRAGMPAPTGADAAGRLRAVHEELNRQLAREPAVRAVTYASALPGMDHPQSVIEIEGDSGGHVVNVAFVGPGFFSTFGQSTIAGREFEARDVKAGGRDVVVNRSFVAGVLAGRSPIGMRLRHMRPPEQPAAPWREIIGVVEDLGMNVVDPGRQAGVYHVAAPGEIPAPHLVIRTTGDAAAFTPRLRAVMDGVEPGIVLANPLPLGDVFSEMLMQARLSGVLFGVVALAGAALSAAGLYALMAFSVAQRRREIAIRIALGAQRSAVVRAVLGRAVVQMAVGLAGGTAIAALAVPEILNEFTQTVDWRPAVGAVSLGLIIIGLTACSAPALRALRIQPADALKAE